MASLDEERIERLREQYGLTSRRRTTSIRKAAAGFQARARGLAASRSRDLDADAYGAAYREAYAGASRRSL